MPNEECTWVIWHAGDPIHPRAVRGGEDIDGSPIYIGRGFLDRNIVPAKVLPYKSVAYIGWDWNEIALNECHVLVKSTENFRWVPARGRYIPSNAVPTGTTDSGETLYTGRVNHSGSLCVGKVHPSWHGCFIPFNGGEHLYKNYEILIK